MNKHIKNALGVIGALSIFLIAVGVLSYTNAFERSTASTSPSFSVSGEGKVVAVPDIAEFSFSVRTEGGKDLSSLQEENSNKGQSAIDFLKENGVDEKDIKTSAYNISPRYTSFPCDNREVCPPSEITGYTVEQSVKVKVRDLESVGSLLSGVVENGANSVSQLAFTVDEPEELKAKARQEAFEKAEQKARDMAEAGDFKLGKLISVQESDSSVPRPYYLEDRAFGGASAPVEPGSQEVKVDVTLEYQIK